MTMHGKTAPLVLLIFLCAPPAAAQLPGDTVHVRAGPQYEAGSVRRALHGDNWRELWTTPVRVPVLDVRTFAGGLRPLRQGGGNQSITLHMEDGRGQRWIFRSINKYPERALPRDLRGTPAGAIVQDHVSIMNPGGHFVLPTLLRAVGILHVQPQLFLMPDDPVLGEYRNTFRGMLGELELRADEGPDGQPGFAGARAVKGSEGLLDDLEDSPAHRLDEREFLRARLVDMLVGDPDRGTDQWRFARFGESGAYTWRPVPVDRDWTFVHADGLLVRAARRIYPKLTRFDESYPSIEALTFSTHILDRRLLTRLTRQDFAAEAERVRAALGDHIIAEAVGAMPPEYAAVAGGQMAATLRARRDSLPALAADFYAWLATDVDVRGTDEEDVAGIERRADGTVLVRVQPRAGSVAGAAGGRNGTAAPGVQGAWYERVFHPAETREVRVHLHGGADHARVTGVATGPIVIRVIGGGGDDVLEDLAGEVRFYDEAGSNTIVRAQGTRFSARPWDAPTPPEGLRADTEWAPDWGRSRSVGPAVGYHDRAGVLVGARASLRSYGFRRLPHHWDLGARAVYAPATGGLRADLELDYRLQNSSRSALLAMNVSTLETFRFHGFGNNSPAATSATNRLEYTQARVEPSMVWHFGRRAESLSFDDAATDTASGDAGAPARPRLNGTLSVGPAFGWTDLADPGPGALPVVRAADDGVAQAGFAAALDLRRTDRTAVPRKGFRVEARTAAYPLVSGAAAGAFATLAARAALYVPLPAGGTHLALRTGGQRVFGDFPLFEAAFLGGRHSLRGYRTERFAGDGSLYGSAELRVPVDTVTLFVRSELGVFAFGDAGRVWYDGSSAGGWHGAWGGGAWLGTLGRAVSFAVAKGEGGVRLHSWLGLPF
jgi:hypothetical protein